MKTTTAFSALARIRTARAIEAKAFVVRSITKSGAVSKMMPRPFDYFTTIEAARKVATEREALNPGVRYVVTDKAGTIVEI